LLVLYSERILTPFTARRKIWAAAAADNSAGSAARRLFFGYGGAG